MDLNETIKSIISEVNELDLSEEETNVVISRILGLGKWEEIRNALLNILYENDSSLWNETIIYIYFFQNRGYKYEDVKTIAILYNCLTLSDELDDNLIWTITKNIKSIPYLSEYEPFQDKEVLEEMEKIKKIRSSS